jgi:2-phospho-L-lactate guanylyltransferase
MPTVVVPFRGTEGKRRLAGLSPEARKAVAEAMLADVLAACAPVGPCYVVTPGGELTAAATIVPDRGTGQGQAVRAGIDAAVADGAPAPYVVVNADLPCATPRDLLALVGSVPDGGLALVAAADGTTNAVAFASAELFDPLYGPGSAERFAAIGPSRVVEAPNLIDDVDTVADLERLRGRLGANTRRTLARFRLGAAA